MLDIEGAKVNGPIGAIAEGAKPKTGGMGVHPRKFWKSKCLICVFWASKDIDLRKGGSGGPPPGSFEEIKCLICVFWASEGMDHRMFYSCKNSI